VALNFVVKLSVESPKAENKEHGALVRLRGVMCRWKHVRNK